MEVYEQIGKDLINNWEDKHLKQHICQVNRLTSILFLLRLKYNL